MYGAEALAEKKAKAGAELFRHRSELSSDCVYFQVTDIGIGNDIGMSLEYGDHEKNSVGRVSIRALAFFTGYKLVIDVF